MKKLLLLILVISISFIMVGCQKETTVNTTTIETTISEEIIIDEDYLVSEGIDFYLMEVVERDYGTILNYSYTIHEYGNDRYTIIVESDKLFSIEELILGIETPEEKVILFDLS